MLITGPESLRRASVSSIRFGDDLAAANEIVALLITIFLVILSAAKDLRSDR